MMTLASSPWKLSTVAQRIVWATETTLLPAATASAPPLALSLDLSAPSRSSSPAASSSDAEPPPSRDSTVMRAKGKSGRK